MGTFYGTPLYLEIKTMDFYRFSLEPIHLYNGLIPLRNVILDSAQCAKLADFGSGRVRRCGHCCGWVDPMGTPSMGSPWFATPNLEMTTARYVQEKNKLCTKIIKHMHLHVIEHLYIHSWTPTVVAHWILTMSHHVTVPSEVGPSAGHYSFGHPAGTVGYCAPEVAQPVRVLP